ncbi:hypothetical protein CPC08DRAFT_707749 [Agrocybe pediades]|nr:hypothetical protein CPC08DRAFT_707749 [Agrocybe pediades]
MAGRHSYDSGSDSELGIFAGDAKIAESTFILSVAKINNWTMTCIETWTLGRESYKALSSLGWKRSKKRHL